MNAIREWWNQNSPRDQLAMFVLGVAFGTYLLYLMVTSAHNKYLDQLDANQRVTVSLNQVRELSAEILARSGSASPANSSNVTEQVNSSLREFNLRLSSMQPQANGAVRLQMEQVSYAAAIAWLHEMEINRGIKIKDSSITTSSRQGSVSLTVTLTN